MISNVDELNKMQQYQQSLCGGAEALWFAGMVHTIAIARSGARVFIGTSNTGRRSHY